MRAALRSTALALLASAAAAEEVKKPQKVAVLGTGLGSISTAFYLSNYEGWEKDWDITVYQMGFKVGGRGAAMRSMGPEGYRIQEHGLHIFMGWYNNAFTWVEDMYSQWDTPPDSPLKNWTDAFKPSCNAAIFIHREDHAGNKSKRPEYVPVGMPGGLINCENWKPSKGAAPSPWALFLSWVRRMEALYGHRKGEFGELLRALDGMEGPPEGDAEADLLARLRSLQAHISGARLPSVPSTATLNIREPTPEDLLVAGERAACVGMAIAIGVVADGMLRNGFAVQNHENTRDWVRRHGCKLPVEKNPISRTGADLTFAYENGIADDEHFNMAAGVALPGIMLVAHALPLKNGTDYFTGSTFVRMQAGMSETLISPAYDVLTKRGVKFNFFHKVEQLKSADGSTVDEVQMRVQATVKAGADKYTPFFKVKGLGVIPNLEKPAECLSPVCDSFLGQLEEGDEIRRNNIDLNSYYGGWTSGSKMISLKKGVDFDFVVNGITAANPIVSSDLSDKSSLWKNFASTTRTDATQSVQVWWYNTTGELGCSPLSAGCSGKPGDSGSEGTICSGAEPFDTWADMTHLLDKETNNDSHTGGAPKAIHYWCSPHAFDTSKHDYTNKSVIPAAFEDVFNNAAYHLENFAPVLFPNTVKDGRSIYDWMVAPPGVKGRDRLRHQYWRTNADPSEQYVLSTAGSINHRPSPAGPGSLSPKAPVAGNAFRNMIVVGDIARTGIDSGCAEAAVTSGLMASHTMTGGKSPAKYTSWLQQMNKTNTLELESL
eukprot:TRINITY_DN32411_c0_g1_i1.p1 TRINITY_DN32411_c0_g1~~TRINITY_DN32411_c0_g1_i1.p1  ORF type:complete len:773 (+),score=268.30 TRINITY_DN32411_c0_g1_i1:88-2406(+)